MSMSLWNGTLDCCTSFSITVSEVFNVLERICCFILVIIIIHFILIAKDFHLH